MTFHASADTTGIDYLQIIKWVLIVLAAGFVGHFGKSLAAYLIGRGRNPKTPGPSEAARWVTSRNPKTPGPSEAAREFVEVPRAAAPPPTLSEGPALAAKAAKKASKALIKMRKKENK